MSVILVLPIMIQYKTSLNLWMEQYEILKPYLDEVPINGSNHWHYKNYNGLLEWTIDNRIEGKDIFQETPNMKYEDYLKIQENWMGSSI